MLTYKLVEETNKSVKYRYFPEGEEEFGTITFEKETGNVLDMNPAETDEDEWYVKHMISKFAEKKELDKKGIIAWY